MNLTTLLALPFYFSSLQIIANEIELINNLYGIRNNYLVVPVNLSSSVQQLIQNIQSKSLVTIIGTKTELDINSNDLIIFIADNLNEKFLKDNFEIIGKVSANICLISIKDFSYKELMTTSKLAWEFKLINFLILFTAANSHIIKHTYNPFGLFRVIKLNASEYYPDKLSNLDGYPFSIAEYNELPRALIRSENSTMEFKGSDAKLIETIVQKMKGKLTVKPSMRTKIIIIKEKIISNHIILAFHHGMENERIYQNKERTYSIMVETLCLIVPASNPYPQYMYCLLALRTDLLFAAVGTLFTVIVVWTILKRRGNTIGLSVKHVLQLIQLLGGAATDIPYSKTSKKEYCLLVPWSLAGIVLANIYLSALTSFTTEPIYEPQYNSLEDIHRKNLTVVMVNTFKHNSHWHYLIIKTEQETNMTFLKMASNNYIKHLTGFNNLYCYVTLTSLANILMAKQSLLNIQRFHILKSYSTSSFFPSFVIANQEVFNKKINEIAFRVYSSGLYYKWMTEPILDANLIPTNCTNTNVPQKLSIKT